MSLQRQSDRLTARQLLQNGYVRVAIIGAILLTLMAFPPTRRLVIILLPTGTRPDDIIAFLIILLGLGYFAYDRTIGERRRNKRLASQRKLIANITRDRIDRLSTLLGEWASGKTPEETRVYRLYPSQRTYDNVVVIQRILAEAARTLAVLGTDKPAEEIAEDLNTIYRALASSDPTLTWRDLESRLENWKLEGGNDPEALSRLQAVSGRHQGDAYIYNPQVHGKERISGAVDYLLDCALEQKQLRGDRR